MTVNAGLISLGGYLPAKMMPESQKKRLVHFLKSDTLLPVEYIDHIGLTGRLPGNIETNDDGWRNQPWFEAWLKNLPKSKQREPFQGTKERRRVPLDPRSRRESLIPHPMLPSDAETLAAALAIIQSGVSKDEIELLLVHSQIPDLPLPSNASLVQHKLKLENAGAYSVDSCCSSFVTMLEIACSLVMAGMRNTILIVCSYIDSHVIDRSTYYSVNTGDAAAAAIVSRVPNGFGYVCSASTSHGDRHKGIILQRRPPKLLQKTSLGGDHLQEYTTFYDLGACREISSNAERDMVEVVQKALAKTDLAIGDVDFFVTHQPVAWAAKAWRQALGIAEDKSYDSFETYGNIATCSVPVNLLEAAEKNLIKAGDRLLLASSGAGENHIAVLERVSPQLVNSIRTALK